MVNRTIILFLLLPWYVLGQESYESNTDRSWRQIEKRLIPPGKTEILLIEQLGADFLIRLDTAGTTTIQDGPDSYHGTEIVLLENLSDRDMEVDLQVAQRFKGVQANVSVESISNPTPSEESLARSLQNFAIAWQAGEYSTEGLESLAPDSSRLSAIGYFTRLQALRLTGQHQKVLSLVKDPPENLTEYKKLRLQWEKAHSLYKTQQITQSLASFSDLAEYLKLDFEDKIEMRLLQKEIRATWGMTLVLSGLSQSSTTVMHEGSEMLDLAMANTRLLADYSMLAEICNFRAAHQSMTGKPDSALKLMRLAESYATEAGNNFLLPMIKNNLAFNLVRKGQIGEAQQLYREAAKMLESTPFKKAHSSLLTRLGTSYQSTGDLRRAFYYHEKSLTSSEDEGLNLFGFQNRLALGSILRSQGNIEEAVRQHLELQQIYSIYLDNWLDERTQLNVELAKDYLDAGDSEKARHYAEKAWSERDKPIRFHYSLDIYTAYAKVLTTLGDLTRAEQVLVSALTKFDGELQQPGRQLELLTELLNLMIEQNRLQEALVTAERAQRLIRTVRNQLNGGNIGPFWDEKTHEITDAYASLLLASEDDGIPIAFNILQANRAISLRQQLHKQSQTEIGEAQSDQKHDRLWHQLLEAQRALIAAEARKEDTTGKRAEVIQAEDRYLATRPNSESVNSADLEILNIAEIQSQLSPDELVLSLLTSDENSFIVQIDSESVFLHHLPNVDIERLSDDAVLQLMNSDALPEISALSDAILGSLNDPSRYSSVIIELYGSLSRLPFAALNMPSTGERLIDQMSITYTPSLSEFFTTREEYEEGVRSAVVLADPEYPTDDEALASSTIRWRNDLSSLDYTRAEALKVADHFDDSIVYLGEDATRSNLLSGDSRYAKILHLASHGFVSERQPGLSGFLLADHHQDGLSGFLTSFDLANHEFHSELVVISGCDTARGELLGNEGMLGLARAFLAQGAKTTIATLWPISDRASAIFMAYFYEALTEGGNSLPESLRLAQTRLKANPRFRHPVFWSPFVLYSLDRSAKPIDKL